MITAFGAGKNRRFPPAPNADFTARDSFYADDEAVRREDMQI
jgi:hypothetical protein